MSDRECASCGQPDTWCRCGELSSDEGAQSPLQYGMSLSEVASNMVQYVDVPVSVRIRQRDKDNGVVRTGIAAIRHVKPNYDGKGVMIDIEDRDIVWDSPAG